ncbi:hypothetical protein [Paraburkholderia tropica]|uniref:hypothetical protein n=1 Tax=Paraburkholderia tropica TaxID=92647 RepID=UPI00161D3C2F|nr:hypothetical protein [Paraburkholderia tropica]MBB6320606.1 hypothetical protein [Paraburkholderia tropica]
MSFTFIPFGESGTAKRVAHAPKNVPKGYISQAKSMAASGRLFRFNHKREPTTPMPTSGDDLSLVKLLSGISASLAVLAGTLSAGWMRARKELSSTRKFESSDKLDIRRDEIEASTLESLARASKEWESQYHRAIARETRYRRLLAVSEARYRKMVQQAAEDRLQDRLKIEALMASQAEKDRRIVQLQAELGGRRTTDNS